MRNRHIIKAMTDLLFFELYSKKNENKTSEELQNSIYDIIEEAYDLGAITGEKRLVLQFEKSLGKIKNEVYEKTPYKNTLQKI
jgi:hypothetical protein